MQLSPRQSSRGTCSSPRELQIRLISPACPDLAWPSMPYSICRSSLQLAAYTRPDLVTDPFLPTIFIFFLKKINKKKTKYKNPSISCASTKTHLSPPAVPVPLPQILISSHSSRVTDVLWRFMCAGMIIQIQKHPGREH
jgi:hypothetical protein